MKSPQSIIFKSKSNGKISFEFRIKFMDKIAEVWKLHFEDLLESPAKRR